MGERGDVERVRLQQTGAGETDGRGEGRSGKFRRIKPVERRGVEGSRRWQAVLPPEREAYQDSSSSLCEVEHLAPPDMTLILIVSVFFFYVFYEEAITRTLSRMPAHICRIVR